MESNLPDPPELISLRHLYSQLDGQAKDDYHQSGRDAKSKLIEAITYLLSRVRQFVNGNNSDTKPMDQELLTQLRKLETVLESHRSELQSLKDYDEHWDLRVDDASGRIDAMAGSPLRNQGDWVAQNYAAAHNGEFGNLISIRASLQGDTAKIELVSREFIKHFGVRGPRRDSNYRRWG